MLGAHAHPRPSRACAATVALAFACVAALPAGAGASTREVTKVYEECASGKLPAGYNQQVYNQATKELEPYLAEYSDCPDLIHKAQLAGARGGVTGGGPGGPSAPTAAVAPPTPTEQRVLERIPHAGAPSVHVGGEVLHPGLVHVNLASAVNALPTPLLVLLAFLLVCVLALFARTVRVRARRRGESSTPGG